jgi:sRNA-binding regulator protein Hfq
MKFRAAAAADPPMAKSKTKAPEQTFEETNYLKKLAETQVPVGVKLSNNEEVTGRIEFFDTSFIRLTRPNEANLFIYKHDIKYLYEIAD